MGKSIQYDVPDQCMWKGCKKSNCKKPWHRPCTFAGHPFEERLKPLVNLIGSTEVILGGIFALLVLLYAQEYDKMYGTEKSKLISMATFCGLITVATSGMILIISVMMAMKKSMWFYVVVATFLSIYIFILSILKLHFALKGLTKGTVPLLYIDPVDETISHEFMLSTACVSGMFTLLGSVIHFIGIVPVFTYYNLKYIQPVMFESEF